MSPEPKVGIRVDRIRCDGYGMCAELLPELIELDDWGYPIVRAGAVPDDLLEHARRAVDVCPVLAFKLANLPPAPSAAPAPATERSAKARPPVLARS
jgi:ferredoxin